MVWNHNNIYTNINSCLEWIKGRFTCGGNIMVRLLKSIILCGIATWHQFSSVLPHSRVWLFMTPWITASQASLSIINSQSLPKLMSIESVMPSNNSSSVVHFSPCLQFFPSGFFQMSQPIASSGQNIGASASISVLQKNTQDWFPLGGNGWNSLQSKGLSSLLQHHEFFSPQLSLKSNSHIHTWLLEKP